MTPRVPQPVVSVRGGSYGVEAHYEQIMSTARRFGQAATDTGGASLSLHKYLFDPALYTSGLLDPKGLAVFEADLADALDGPSGLTQIATRCGLLDAGLRAAVLAYRTVDNVAHDTQAAWDLLRQLPSATLHAIEASLANGATRAGPAIFALLAGDPQLVDALMDAGLISVDGLVANAEPTGHAKVADAGRDERAAALAPPRCLADVIAGLGLRNRGKSGEIDVKILTCADGTRRVIVDIPGTKSWDPRPTSDVTSFSTNARALVGERTTYEQGVLMAMARAGVKPTDHVMLVGHSEGGMVAVTTARDAVNSGKFDVTNVVTAGAPIALSAGALPRSVRVLALENEHDFVPHLDGKSNPDQPNITTVTVNHGDGTEGDDHSIQDGYLPGAVDVDASSDSSVRDFLTGAGGYFSATSVQTKTYVITRAY